MYVEKNLIKNKNKFTQPIPSDHLMWTYLCCLPNTQVQVDLFCPKLVLHQLFLKNFGEQLKAMPARWPPHELSTKEERG